MRKSPPQIATALATELQSKGLVPKGFAVSTAGPYVNFTIAPELVFGALIQDILIPDPTDALGAYGRVSLRSRGSWVL